MHTRIRHSAIQNSCEGGGDSPGALPRCWCEVFLQHLAEFGSIAYLLTENEAAAEELVLKTLDRLSLTKLRPAKHEELRKQVWIAMLNESLRLRQAHGRERSSDTHQS